jgi:hypothetical protein
MKTAVRRLRRLEVRFASTLEATRKVPTAAEMIVERLAAGEWQCAMQLLERRDLDARQEQQLIEHWGADPSGRIDLGVMGLTRLRQTLERSLSDLPPELRYDIARRLLEADTE